MEPETYPSLKDPSSSITYPPTNQPPQKSISGNIYKTILIFLIIVFVLTSASFGFYFFYIEPKIKTVAYSKKLIENLTQISSSLSKIDYSLNQIYQTITKEVEPDIKKNETNLLFKLNRQGQVSGASTIKSDPKLSLYHKKISNLALNLKNTNRFGQIKKDVLGEEIEDPVFLESLREIKDLSNEIISLSQEGISELEKIRKQVKETTINNDELLQIKDNLERLNTESDDFFKETSKTADYYFKLVDIRMEFTPFLASYTSLLHELSQVPVPYLYAARIEELKKTIDAIYTKLIVIKKEELPQGIESLHQDNIKTLEIFKNNVLEVKNSIENEDYQKYLQAVIALDQNMEPLSTRSVSLELSFWQNNKIIKKGKKLAQGYKKIQSQLQKLIEENKIPLILTQNLQESPGLSP